MPEEWAQEAFGPPPRQLPLALAAGELADRVRGVIEEVQRRRLPGPRLQVRLVPPATEEFAKLGALLVEDPMRGFPDYKDTLCKIHATVQTRMREATSSFF